MARAAITMLGTIFLALAFTPGAVAQTPNVIDTQDAAREVCTFSDARPGESARPDTPQARDAATYLHSRRSLASTPLQMRISESEVAHRRYDRVTGALEVPIFRDLTFLPGWSLRLTPGEVLRFPASEARAAELLALLKLGQARLVVDVLPRAFRRWDEAFCTPSEARHIIHGTLLTARIVDPVGKELARFRTPLGDEVATLRTHKIDGYLGGALPTVTVSSMVMLEARNGRSPKTLHAESENASNALARLRVTMERELFGCYIRGLSQNSRLQGALVATFSLEDDDARVLVDSIHDATVVECTLERLNALSSRLNGDLPSATTLRATTIFRLQDAGSL